MIDIKPSKHDQAFVVKLTHFLFLLTVTPLLLTGLRIAVANDPDLTWLSMAFKVGCCETDTGQRDGRCQQRIFYVHGSILFRFCFFQRNCALQRKCLDLQLTLHLPKYS